MRRGTAASVRMGTSAPSMSILMARAPRARLSSAGKLMAGTVSVRVAMGRSITLAR